MREQGTSASPPLFRIIIAFAAVYLIWGSTYLAIRIAIETLPPFLMAGVRFVVAGVVLYVWMRVRGATRPAPIHWRSAALIGGLLLLGGNGSVVWAEQRVPSGTAALIVAAVPMWMVLLDWIRPNGMRPEIGTITGLLIGFVGVGLLIGTGHGGDAPSGVDPVGAGVLVLATVLWATGSICSRSVTLPSSQWLTAGMEMIVGGVLLVLAGTVSGEWGRLNLGAASPRSLLALGYLIVFGSLIGFSAYVWLLQATTPARVSTYAYVNPVVAVFLGWWIVGETLTGRTILAGAIIVSSVVLITLSRSGASGKTAPSEPQSAAPPIPEEPGCLARGASGSAGAIVLQNPASDFARIERRAANDPPVQCLDGEV